MRKNNIKVGLALGSGAARGWAHIGVIRALQEQGIEPEIIAGSSVGALVGAAYASNQLDELEHWACELSRMDVWRSLDGAFGKGGVIRGARIMRNIKEAVVDKKIESLPKSFAAVAADLYTGQEVWMQEGSMLEAVRASSGLPGLFAPKKLKDRWLIDGGVVNPVPVSLCHAMGAEYVIAVNLNSFIVSAVSRQESAEEDAEEEEPEANGDKSRISEKWSDMLDNLMSSMRSDDEDEDNPKLIDVVSATINIMQDRITRSRMAGDPANLMIAPKLNEFKLLDFHRAKEAVEQGRRAVLPALPELKTALID